VHEVGYLQELNRDARLTIYKILLIKVNNNVRITHMWDVSSA